MADIPPKVFIIVGALVAIASLVINYIEKFNNLVLFVFAGIAMVIYGISKLPKHKKTKHPHHNRKPSRPPAPRHTKAKYCHTCGSAVHPNARFCHACGARLR